MNALTKNILVILAIVTAVFVAYYFLTQENSAVLRTSNTDAELQTLLRTAEVFRERQLLLESISLNTDILSRSTFTTLRSPSPTPAEYQIGRPDPFLPATRNAFTPPATLMNDSAFDAS